MRKSTLLILSVSVLFCAILLSGCSKQYDIVLQNGTIYDGTGGEPFTADLGIKDGVITAVGTVEPDANMIVDVSGRYITPGFIDIHNHATFDKEQAEEFEADFDELKQVKNYLFQGVTTVVSGNCGAGETDIFALYAQIEREPVGPNFMQLIGHGSVREEVMGSDNRAPTPEEMEKMKDIVRRGMEAGSPGLSTGLFYAPGSYAETEEVIELAKVVAEYGGIYASHVRDEGVNLAGGVLKAMEEAIQVGEEAGVPVQISHLKAAGKLGWGNAEKITGLFEAAQARGVKLYADQYPYTAGSTSLAGILINRWMMEGGREKMLERFIDPELRPRILEEITARIDRYTGPQNTVIASCRERKQFEGKNLLEVSETLGLSPAETVIDLITTDQPGCVVFMMRPEDVDYFMQKPYVMTGSDGMNFPFGMGVPHPRNYGAFMKKIRTFVMERNVITMEQAIRAATSLPADMLGLEDRGIIKEGMAADVLVFNPETVTDNATYAEPHQYCTGIDELIINGKSVIHHGEYIGTLAGKALKF